MYRLFETIKIIDGVICNIRFHNERFNRARAALFGCSGYTELGDFIKLPPEYREGIVKCKIVYSRNIDSVAYARYEKRTIHSLKIVIDDAIDYSYKYHDRTVIDRLLESRKGCDDIIIVKNGMMTDSSFSNLVFDDGKNLLTPAAPLLKGTKRAQLLSEGIIAADEIRLKDMKLFKSVHLINAMLDLYECRVGIDNIQSSYRLSR